MTRDDHTTMVLKDQNIHSSDLTRHSIGDLLSPWPYPRDPDDLSQVVDMIDSDELRLNP
jgi:hypothetical protein